MIVNLIISLLVAAPAIAQTAPDQTAPPAAAKPICRREVVTGSIMPGKKTCHTKAEWKQIDTASQRAIDDYHNRSATGGDIRGN